MNRRREREGRKRREERDGIQLLLNFQPSFVLRFLAYLSISIAYLSFLWWKWSTLAMTLDSSMQTWCFDFSACSTRVDVRDRLCLMSATCLMILCLIDLPVSPMQGIPQKHGTRQTPFVSLGSIGSFTDLREFLMVLRGLKEDVMHPHIKVNYVKNKFLYYLLLFRYARYLYIYIYNKTVIIKLFHFADT